MSAGVRASAARLAQRVSVVMTYPARRAHAEYWWLRGFLASGRGFHGETYDAVRYPALVDLLLVEFSRAWDALHASAREEPPCS